MSDASTQRFRTLPDARRSAVVVLVVATALVAVALGVRYAGETYPRWLDQTALTSFRDWFPIPRRPARLVIGLFDPVPLAVLVAVLAGVSLALRRRRLAVLAVAGPVLSGLTTTLLKPVIDRTKNGELVYPSGHMAAAVAVALVVALLLVNVFQPRRWMRIAVLVTAPAVTGAGVGLAMIVTNYHYLTDAVGGFCVAVAVVLSLALLLDRWPPLGSSRRVRSPAA
jgi:undecaprenyl-diphosphatase